MNSRNPLFVLIFMALFVNILAQEEDNILEDLIINAIRISPKVELLKSKVDITRSRIEQSTNLPDPLLTLGIVNVPTNTFSFRQEPMTGKVIGITQAFPFPGGLSAKANAIAIDTLIAKHGVEDYKNEIRKNVSSLYYSLQAIREEKQIITKNRKLLNQILDVVKRKYEVSETSFQNIINVEVQITRLKDKLETILGKENGIVSELNAYLLQKANSPIITNRLTPISKSVFSVQASIEVANKYRPFLKGIKLYEKKYRLLQDVAEYSYYPNFQVSVNYTQRDYSLAIGQNWNDIFSVVVGITLPLGYGGKYSSKVNETLYQQNFYREQYSSSIQILRQSTGKIIAELNALQKREILISDSLLPQAEQGLSASLTDYQVGRIDFVNVINAENDILKIETELIEIRAEYYKSIAQLEFLIGTKLNSK